MDRILIVDDDLENILLAKAALERAGFEVEGTTDPREAAGMASRGDFDAVVLDLVMPEVSGFDVLSALRSQAETRVLPILFLSSQAAVADRVRGLREGADDYLGKPFHPEELVLRVERLVATSSAENDGLEGRLEDFPIADVIQTVVHGRKSGFLVVYTPQGTGRLLLEQARVLTAHYDGLFGRDALLAVLGLDSGRFRFRVLGGAERTSAAPGEGLDLQAALFEAAWLADEIAHRRELEPGRGEPLAALPLPPDFAPFPGLSAERAREVHARVERSAGLTLEDLLAARLAAPQEVRLIVVHLLERGALARLPEAPAEGPA